MFYYYCLIAVTIAIILLCVSWYMIRKDEKIFTGRGLREGLLMRKIIDALVPPPNSDKDYTWKNIISILNSRMSIRDIYFARIVSTLCAFLIGMAIVITNVANRYDSAFELSPRMPVRFTSSDYKILTGGISFTEDSKLTDEKEIVSNINLLEDPESRRIYSNLSKESLYNYSKIIHDELSNLFGLFDVLLIILVTIFGWLIVPVFLKSCFRILANNELFEYDNLETEIVMSAEQPIIIILSDLEKSALFYREMIYRFRTIYADSPKKAYDMVFSRREFPEHFKKLIRYLNMIEINGPTYAKKQIISTKKITEEDVYTQLRKINRRKIRNLNIITTVAFLLSFARVLYVLFSSL